MIVTKTQRLIGFMRASDWNRALSLASTFKKLGEHRTTIVRANECRWHPQFFAQLGLDPETTVAAGIAALQQLYPLPQERNQ